ncbi:MBL fold metallo-hydrolase [Desulfovibrio sp. OttesenSCG-928-G15]|nr:MBL fold metallo-hydrolase [Desulfovibrio sp. OttesenSCG-928-G15]
MKMERFGKLPEGKRLARVQASPNYWNGEFHNTVPTRMLAEGQSSMKIMWDSLWAKDVRLRPVNALPTLKPDLTSFDISQDMLVWLGHSAFYIQLGGKRILVDPVFSTYGAPFSFANKIFPGTDLYAPADMPEIDFLLVTHDHWDHLDHPTVKALAAKVKKVVCPLGVGAHFERWGFSEDTVIEADWNTALPLADGMTIHVVPARHFSGRTLTRNKSLWAGFVLETPQHRIFLSGDSGYGPHIRELAEKFGGFTLAAIDGGQYDPRWPQIHMTPEQASQAAEDLGAQRFLLAHVGRFCIASHPWDEPFERVVAASKDKTYTLLTPKIGEPVTLGDTKQEFGYWWKGLQ